MRKSTIFISAVLTTFALVMLYQVAAAYTSNKTVTQVDTPTVLPDPTATEPPATEPSAPADVALGPEQAASLAAQVVGNTDLLSAETSNFNGTNAYMITFANNDIVYVGLDGQILSVQIATPTPAIVNVSAPSQKKSNSGGSGSASSSSRDNHDDDHDEHEDHDDD